MMHFVRRRRIIRNAGFSVSRLFTGTCDHCDLSEKNRLSNQLLNVLATVCSREGSSHISEPKVVEYKTKLYDILNISPSMDRLTYNQLISRIYAFVSSNNTMWRQASSSLFSNDETRSDHIISITNQLNSFYFQYDERNELVSLLIRKHDIEYQYHCEINNCGEKCRFRPVTCPNDGCHEVISLLWVDRHDSQCPFKIIACERECGDHVIRREMESHLASGCPLRPVLCPFNEVGCDITELTHRDLPHHLDTCMQSHIMLLLTRVVEHQQVIKSTNKKVIALETQSNTNTTLLATLQAGLAANVIAIEKHEKHTLKTLRDEMHALEKKHTKSENNLQTEVNAVKITCNRVDNDLKNFQKLIKKS